MSITAPTYLGTTAAVGTNPATMNGISFGTTDPNRWIFACITSGTISRTFTSVTIGGITAIKLAEADGSPSSRPSAIYVANVPTNTNQDVVCTQSGSNTMQCSLYSTVGNLDTTPIATFLNIGQSSLGTVSLATRNGGILIGIASGVSSATTFYGGDFDVNDVKNAVTGGGQASHKSTLNTGATLTNVVTGNCGSIDTAIAISMGPINTDAVSIDQTLSKLTQSVAITEKIPGTIAQTLKGITQSVTVAENIPSTIATTLKSPTQSVTVAAGYPVTIAQTLFGFSQEIDAAEAESSTIATTLFAPVQELDAYMQPNANVAQTLLGLSQEIDVSESVPSAIDQTLRGLTQEIDAAVVLANSINMILCAGPLRPTALTPLVYITTFSPLGNPATFNSDGSVGLGFESPDRWIFACVTSGTSDRTFTSVTIGGVAAIKMAEADGGGTTRPSVIYVANVPNNGNQEVVVTESGSNTIQCSLFSTTGNLDTTPVDSFARIDQGADTVSLNTRNGGVAFGVASGVTNGNTFFGGGFDTLDWKNNSSGGGQGSNKAALTDGSALSVTVQTVGSIDTAVGVSVGTILVPSTGLVQELLTDVTRNAVIAQTLAGFTQEIDVRSTAALIAQTLPHITIGSTVIESIPTRIDQTLFGITQELDNIQQFNAVIAQTLPGFSQEIDVSEIVSHISTALPGVKQEIDIGVSPAAQIDTTLEGLTQRVDVVESLPNFIDQTLLSILQSQTVIVETLPTHIDQTLAGFSQEIDVVEVMTAAIDQTLFGFSQEIDVESTAGTIDTQLSGFSQEIDVVESIPTYIDQTLQGLMQELDATEQDPPGVTGLHIDQTLAGFTQEIDVSALKIDISVELQGMTQRATVTASTAHHKRGPHAATMPSKDMPIHPGELEFFRGKVYGRAIDALVPPPVTARYNLTTRQYPTSRIAVDRTPLGKKPS